MKKSLLLMALLASSAASADERYSTSEGLKELLTGTWACQGYGQYYSINLQEGGQIDSRSSGGSWEALDGLRWRRVLDNGSDSIQEITVVNDTTIKIHGRQTSSCTKK